MDQERLDRVSTAIARWACVALLIAGVVHAFVVLVTGDYRFSEYGIAGRMEGWNARIGAALELAVLLTCALGLYRSELLRPPE